MADYEITINNVGYMLARDEEDRPRFFEGRTSEPHETIAGQPRGKFVAAYIKSLEGGFGADFYDPQNPNRYAVSTGAYCVAPGSVGPANRVHHYGIGFSDPTAEETGAGLLSNPWTVSNAAMAADNTTDRVFEGAYSWKFTTSVAGGIAYQTPANPTAFQNRAMRLRATMRNNGDSEEARLFIWDNVTGFTYMAAASPTSYTTQIVEATIDASATDVRFGIEDNGSNTITNGMWVDAWNVDSQSSIGFGFATIGTDIYTASGRIVHKWNESTKMFDVVDIHTGGIITGSPVEFGGDVYIPYGAAVAFLYGSDTTWIVSSNTGNSNRDQQADFFARGMDSVGNDILVKARKPNTIGIATDPKNSGSGFVEYTVGESDSDITNVYFWQRTIIVGKTDGLYVFQNDHFENITTQFEVAVSADNFSVGQEWDDWLYLSGSMGTAWRLTWGAIEGPLKGFKIEGYEYGPGGQVGAWGTDGAHLIIGLNENTTASTPWILLTEDGKTIHTLHDLASPTQTGLRTGDTNVVWPVDPMLVFGDEIEKIVGIGTVDGFTYVLGTGSVPHFRHMLLRWAAPATSQIPYRDTAFDTSPVWAVRLPKMDAGFPSDDKSWHDVHVWTRPQQVGNIYVYYRSDGGAWAALGNEAVTGSNPHHVFTFSDVSGKIIELIIYAAGATESTALTDNTRPLEALPVMLTAKLRPDRNIVWSAFVKIGTGVGGLGVTQIADESLAQYANLRTAEKSDTAVAFGFVEDLKEEGTVTTDQVHVVNVTLDSWEPNPNGGWTRIYRVDMVEE